MLHAIHAFLSPLVEIKHRLWICIFSVIGVRRWSAIPGDSAAPFLLVRDGSLPWLVNVLLVKLGKLRAIPLDQISFRIPLFAKGYRRVAAVKHRVKRRAGQPLPITDVASGFVYDLCELKNGEVKRKHLRSISSSSKTSAPLSQET